MADISQIREGAPMSFGQQLKLTVMLSLRQCSRNCRAFSCNISTRRWWTARSRRLGRDRTCVDKPLALLGHLFRRHYGILGTGRPQGRSQGRRSRTQRAATSHNRVPHIQPRRDSHRHCHRPSLPRWLGGNDDITPRHRSTSSCLCQHCHCSRSTTWPEECYGA